MIDNYFYAEGYHQYLASQDVGIVQPPNKS